MSTTATQTGSNSMLISHNNMLSYIIDPSAFQN